MLYNISYDLHKPGQSYEPLFTAIKSLGPWYHVLKSTWLVRSNLTAAQIRDHLAHYIDTNDILLVSGINGWASWGINGDWLNNNAA